MGLGLWWSAGLGWAAVALNVEDRPDDFRISVSLNETSEVRTQALIRSENPNRMVFLNLRDVPSLSRA